MKYLGRVVLAFVVFSQTCFSTDQNESIQNLDQIISINDKDTGFDIFKDLKKVDTFHPKNIYKDKTLKKNKQLFVTEEFFLKKGTKVILKDKVMRIPQSLRVKVLYNPTLALNNIVDKSGKIVFKVETKNLISTLKSEGIEIGTIDVSEDETEVMKQLKDSKFFLRFGYGGSLFEDSFC